MCEVQVINSEALLIESEMLRIAICMTPPPQQQQTQAKVIFNYAFSLLPIYKIASRVPIQDSSNPIKPNSVFIILVSIYCSSAASKLISFAD